MLIFAGIKHNILKGLTMWIYLTYAGLKTILILVIIGLALNVLKNLMVAIDNACKIDIEDDGLKAENLNIPYVVFLFGVGILYVFLFNDILLIEAISSMYNLPIEKAKEIINLYQGGINE